MKVIAYGKRRMTKKRRMTSRAIIIFIKNPILGTAKTRLAQSIGNEKALEVYRKLLSITRKVSRVVRAKRYLYYNRFIDTQDDWSEVDFFKKIQADGNLGTKMKVAFREVSAIADKVIIIGSDCPTISSSLIEDAFDILEIHDVVVGPSPDGGYYLLGMKKCHDALFENIEWSTPKVLNQTVSTAEEMGLTVHLLPQHNDIDTIEDWESFQDTQQ